MVIPIEENNTTRDADFHLRHKALYVEPLRQPIDWSKMPADGNEYIHRVRAEAEAVMPNVDWGFCPAVSKELNAKSIAEGRHLLFSYWKGNEGLKFCSLSSSLDLHRRLLVEKFPKRLRFPAVEDEKEVCLFLLGSKLYSEIYPAEECPGDNPGHPPLLSIVLHIGQEDILALLKYLRSWGHMCGDASHEITVWIYALLLCLRKPITGECETFLERFHDECVEKSKGCEEKNQVNLLETILYNGFSLKSHKIRKILRCYSKQRYCK